MISILRKINFVGEELWYEFWINTIAKSAIIPNFFKRIIWRCAGLQIKANNIKPGLTLRGNKLVVGKDSFLNYNCFIDASAPVNIGNKVHLGFGVHIITSTHEQGNKEMRAGDAISKPIVIEDGCWIGANSTILPGVTIRQGCIVAAGSMVNKDCDVNGLYAGVPAKRIRDL